MNKIEKQANIIEDELMTQNTLLTQALEAYSAEAESVLPDSGERSEFSTGAVRDAMTGKGTPSLIPIDALRAVSKRFEDGATKYGRNNWKKGIPLSRYVASLYRHLWQFMEGDTSEDHGGAVIWNAMCLIQTKEWIEQGKLPSELNDL